MTQPWPSFKAGDMQYAHGFRVAFLDEVQSRDLTSVDQLPITAIFIDAACPRHNFEIEQHGIVTTWRQLALFAGQIDAWIGQQLPGVRGEFAVLRQRMLDHAQEELRGGDVVDRGE